MIRPVIIHAARGFRLRPLDDPLRKPMDKRVTCAHCPESFIGRGMWNAYARHIKAEHR